MRPEYLPPYSPDDPAEEGFSMKAWLRANRDYADEAPANTPGAPSPYEVIFRAVYESITPEKARDWFTHSGYS
ncbi:hypothetical protein K438DRAFT_1626268 [Mycena galopus ATCC 62051]|nr:hypothetical protein K438DRAFT_1626268 [Mycena galopus ATCC 62051]